MKNSKLLAEFEKFQKNESVQAEELQKISGGTCIFYCSNSQHDCDRDDYTYTSRGEYKDIDAYEEPHEDRTDWYLERIRF